VERIKQLRARRRRIVWIALAAAIAVGCALRLVHFDDVASRSPDERFYTEFARQLADRGLAGMHSIYAEYESDPVRWNYPSPTRIGHLVFVAAVMKISDVKDEQAGAAVSLAFGCMSLFLLAWIGVRFFNAWIAVAAVAFLDTSVGELGMARRAWQDSPFGFFGLFGVYLTCEIVRNPRRLWLYPAFLAAGALNLLTKQTGVISYGVCALWLLGYLIFRLKWWRGAILLALGGIASIGVTIGLWGILAGDTSVALSALNHSLHPTAIGLGYLESCCTGPWYQFFYLLWIVGPLPAALAFFGVAVSLFPQRLLQRIAATSTIAEPNCASVAAWMTIGFFGFSSLYPGMQCLRYVSPANGCFALLAGLGFWYLLALARGAMGRADHRLLVMLAVLGMVIAGARDYRTFTSVVVRSQMNDLAVRDIRKVMDR
jgi:4-amino-4-deoxy-L-arabinose transferase-like glycosyltransferase